MQVYCFKFFSSFHSRTRIVTASRFLFCAAFVAGLPCTKCLADGPQDRTSLFSRFALEKVEQRRGRGGFASRVLAPLPEPGSNGEWAYNLENFSDVLDEQKNETTFMTENRAPFYLNYVYDDSNSDDFADAQNKSLAERALLFQAASSLTKLVIGSGLEPYYRQSVEMLRTLKQYISLKVQRTSSGGLRLGEISESEKPLFKLKLRVSADEGVQPCVDVGDNFSLRHDVFRDETIVEFRKNF